jgi:hypothetical protein
MMAVLEFMFGGFWRFVGCMIALSLVTGCITSVARSIASAFRRKD